MPEATKEVPKRTGVTAEDFKQFITLLETLNRDTAGFHHSAPILEYVNQKSGLEMKLGLREVAMLATVANVPILLIGPTGDGKTQFSLGLMYSFFGDDCGKLTIDPSLDQNKFRNIAPGQMAEGKWLGDVVKPAKIVTGKAVLMDEFNRAPAALVNALKSWLTLDQMEFDGGYACYPGVPFENGNNGSGRFQLRIATINDGAEYGGTFDMDQADANRFGVKIDFKYFPTTDDDVRNIIREGGFSPHRKEKGQEEAIFQLNRALKGMEIAPLTVEFLRFLSDMDNCFHSPEGTKRTISNFSAEFCQKAQCKAYASDASVCPNMFAPSSRQLIYLRKMSQAFAAYRLALNPNSSDKVEVQDIIAMAPLVLSVKDLKLPGEWVVKTSEGSEMMAIKNAMNFAYGRFVGPIKANSALFARETGGAELTETEKRTLEDLVQTNPWARPRAGSIEVFQKLHGFKRQVR